MADKILWMGGLQTHGQGVKADSINTWCEDQTLSQITFHPIDYQDPKNGYMDQWIKAALTGISHFNKWVSKDNRDRHILVASSFGAWVAARVVYQIYPQASNFFDHVVAISPALDVTRKLEQQMGLQAVWAQDPNRIIEIPVPNADKFPLSQAHVERAKPYLLQGSKWVQELRTSGVTLSVLTSAADMEDSKALVQAWTGEPAKDGDIIPLQGGHYENNSADMDLILAHLQGLINQPRR